LARREADMAIAVSPRQAGRPGVLRPPDHQLHLAAHQDYLRAHPPIRSREDLHGHRLIGYIADMIFDRELDYLPETGMEWAALTSNSVSVQMQAIRAGAGLGFVHDFAVRCWPGAGRGLSGQASAGPR